MKLARKMLLWGALVAVSMAAGVSGIAQGLPSQNLPEGWQLMRNDTIAGANVEAARKLLQGQGGQDRAQGQASQVVVALLDTGIDLSNPYLQGAIWRNAGETAGNGIDDDGNGYADDVNGWNFLGSSDGEYNLTSAGSEAFREYKRLRPRYRDVADGSTLPRRQKSEYDYYKSMEKAAGIGSYMVFAAYLEQIAYAFMVCDSLLVTDYPCRDTLGRGDVARAIGAGQYDAQTEKYLTAVFQRFMLEPEETTWGEIRDKNIAEYKVAMERIASLDDITADPRHGIGDDPEDFKNLDYGNGNVDIADTGQATVLAGVVAGVYPEAEIMPVRVLAQGEPYDKDIVSGIKYAADNGAKVINIGFVKTLSPHAREVQKAFDYARRKDVLIVCAAGDRGVEMNEKKGDNVVVVGATDAAGERASFSNYGVGVDIYAPGTAVVSTLPGGEWAMFEGSDISAAVVSGVAAMLRARFPELSASRLREILTGTASPYGSGAGLISASDGASGAVRIVDAAGAVTAILSGK